MADQIPEDRRDAEHLEPFVSGPAAATPDPEVVIHRVSPEYDKLFAALAKAQGDIEAAEMSRENTYLKSKYADLTDCWDACRKPLSDNGLCVIQLPQPSGPEEVALRTILGHSSGQFIESTMLLPVKDFSAHGIGTALTYLRRYMLNSMIGVSSKGDDDDGEAATGGSAEERPLEAKQVDAILIKADELFGSDSESVLKRMCTKVFRVAAVADIPGQYYEQALTLLANQKEREKSAADDKTAAAADNKNDEADGDDKKPQTSRSGGGE